MFFRKRLKKFDPEKEKTLREQIEAEGGLEKNDGLAMVLSALLVFLPIALVILLVLVLVGYLFIS
ncbi:MAG: hypothetical protein J6Q89_01460 [Clostridia bacterium]|nr:hypothetical protein [Clostridia bacterium]